MGEIKSVHVVLDSNGLTAMNLLCIAVCTETPRNISNNSDKGAGHELFSMIKSIPRKSSTIEREKTTVCTTRRLSATRLVILSCFDNIRIRSYLLGLGNGRRKIIYNKTITTLCFNSSLLSYFL